GYSFGVGGSSIYPEWDTGGGGGGWFGGRSGVHNNGGASGGSGFVWMGAADVSQAVIGGTWLLTADQKLESGRTVAGNQSFPATGGGDEIGHKGNGYARITFVE
ncbi:MAG: fimbrillin family protein, partial [Proteobacteria bacterium]|nr:fimbrillin family protein [Pseudomonadota bacterium]